MLSITEQQAQKLRVLGDIRSVKADAAVRLESPIPGSTSKTQSSSGESLSWRVRAVEQGNDVSQ
jgi:hypothetical protein